MSESGKQVDVRLSCQPNKIGNLLVFPYTLENRSEVDIYAMAAFPGTDPATHEAFADERSAIVMLHPAGDAIVGRFIPLPPTDRKLFAPLIPLARKLAPGATLESRLEIPAPLAETSPYFPDLTLREYEIVDIAAVRLTIGYWAGDTPGLAAGEAPYAPDFLAVITRDTVRSARQATQRFPVKGLQLFKRTGPFPRPQG